MGESQNLDKFSVLKNLRGKAAASAPLHLAQINVFICEQTY